MRKLSAGLVALFLLIQIANSEDVHGCTTADAKAVFVNGTWVLMREDGTVMSNESYCHGGEYSNGLIRFDLCHSNLHDYLTPTGERTVRVTAAEASDFGEGLAAVQDKETGNWGYIDKTGHMVIPPKYEEAGKFSEGLAPVSIADVRQYIDSEGKVVLTPHRDGWTVFAAYPFNSGAALIMFFDRATGAYEKTLIDRSGKWLITPTERLTGELNNGLAPLWDASVQKMGFINSSGKFVIPPQFIGSAELPFEEGLAAVWLGRQPNIKVGFIDKQGGWAIPATYEDAYHFCGGLAPADGLWGFIDSKGGFAIQPKFPRAESFEDGIAEVYAADENGKFHRELINRKGTVLFHETTESVFVTLQD